MSNFDPASVIATLKRLKNTLSEQRAFESKWNEEVRKRVTAWTKNRTHQSHVVPQLTWEAHVVEYVNFIFRETKVHGNSKSIAKTTQRPLSRNVPIYGPRFTPPTYLELQAYSAAPKIEPDLMYLKPMSVIHPFYYPELARCPQCGSETITWNGWTATGHREVHGLCGEETALGYQLQCKVCVEEPDGAGTAKAYCLATTNRLFWKGWDHYSIPRGIPYFFKRCAVTRELFNVITEMRLTGTAGGLEEHIKQLHLLEYKQRQLEYLRAFQRRCKTDSGLNQMLQVTPLRLTPFSGPDDEKGYNDSSITHDLITDVYQEFSEKTRQEESMKYLRTLTGEAISLDSTFKSASKATIVDKERRHLKVMKGGIQSIINEYGEILSWRLCQNGAGAETTEMLDGINRRCEELGVLGPGTTTTDNCCAMRNAIKKALPNTSVVLDVYHFMMRYVVTILGGTRNPHRKAVGKDIVSAILKQHAQDGKPAEYWSQEDQERKLIAVYEKWAEHGDVWSAATAGSHAQQLLHVQKGCLARTRQDIPSDGSRIEGSHRGWNSLMRSFPCGLENFCALGHDFVLRRNIRIAEHRLITGQMHGASGPRIKRRTFVDSTFGSHHIGLVDQVAKLWNSLLRQQRERGPLHIDQKSQALPELPEVNSGETFGIVNSAHSASFGGLWALKEDSETTEPQVQCDPLDDQTEGTEDPVLEDVDPNIDPALLLVPAQPAQKAIKILTVPNIKQAVSDGCLTPQFVSVVDHLGATHLSELGTSDTSSTTQQFENAVISTAAVDLTLVNEQAEPQVASDHTQIFPMKSVQHEAVNTMKRKAEESVADELLGEMQLIKPQDLAGLGHRSKKARTAAVVLDLPQHTSGSDQPGCADSRAGEICIQTPALSSSESRTITLPSKVHHFFTKHPQLKPPYPTTLNQARSLEDLATPLSLPDPNGLTRSQRLFSISTGIDFRSLALTADHEYFLFMEMRREKGWTTFNMTSHKWVVATKEYNIRLEAIDKKNFRQTILKNPRALLEKLAEVEAKILQRIATENFVSKSGSTRFWKLHCFAVPLGKEMDGALQDAQSGKGKSKGGQPRKRMVCSRCRVLMYPAKTGSPDNHKRDYCSDGAPIKFGKHEGTPWPQPEGIFMNGSHFNPMKFLATIRDIYGKVFDEQVSPGNYAMEYEAFAHMLLNRCEQAADGAILFRLFDKLSIPSSEDWAAFIVQRGGREYLRIDCLREGHQ